MLKQLRQYIKDYIEVQSELGKMGVFNHPYGSYVNSEMFTAYWEKKKLEEGDQSSPKV